MLRTISARNTGTAVVDVDGSVGSLVLKINLERFFLPGVGQQLCTIKSGNVIGDVGGCFQLEELIINAQTPFLRKEKKKKKI